MGIQALLRLPAARFRLVFLPSSEIVLHQNNAPMFRGALGTALHEMDLHGAYRNLFDDGSEEGAIRPYRFRTELGPHGSVPAGQPFHVDLDLYGEALPLWPLVEEAARAAGNAGFGEDRVRCRLNGRLQALPEGWYDVAGREALRSFVGDLYPPMPTAALWFASPALFKSNGSIAAPSLDLAGASAVRRAMHLMGQGERVDLPPVPEGRWEWRERHAVARKSRRAGRHTMIGWTGMLRLPPLSPEWECSLALAEALGVGRHVVLGWGDVRRVLR